MARIAGIDLPDRKHVNIALTYIHGIGRTRADSIVKTAGVESDKKVMELTADEVSRIRKVIIDEGSVEGDLRRQSASDINRLIEIASYRGMRHRRGLPVRGQRTHTNARTRRGPRRGIVSKKSKRK